MRIETLVVGNTGGVRPEKGQMKETIIIHKRDGYYSAFPVLNHLPDGRLSVAIPRARFRDHYAVDDWVVLVSTDEGSSWAESDDLSVPANWPGATPREKYDRFCAIRDDGSYLCTGTMGWEVWPAERAGEACDQDFTVIDHPNDNGLKLVHRHRIYLKHSHNGGSAWNYREWNVPGYATIIGFPRAVEIADGTILVPVRGRRRWGDEFVQEFVWRSTGLRDSFALLPLPMGPSGDEAAFLGIEGTHAISLSRSERYFVQRWSTDSGRTWSQPLATNIDCPRSPPHLLRLRDGRILCTYGYRRPPMGVRAVFSHDGGQTWDVENTVVLRDDGGYPSQLDPNPERARSDNGYPMSTQLSDGSILSVYYITTSDQITHVAATRWDG